MDITSGARGTSTPNIDALLWRIYYVTKTSEKSSKRRAEQMLSTSGSVDQEALIRWVNRTVKEWKLA
jgi:hypothetical protein